MKDLAEMSPDEVRAEVDRRADRRRQGLPLAEVEPHTSRRIAEEQQDDRLEKELQRDVVKLYLAFHCQVFNLSQARASKQSPGLGDLYVVHLPTAQVWWHETKTPTGRQSPAQKQFQTIHKYTPVGYVMGRKLHAEEHLIKLGIAQRAPDGTIEPIRKATQ